MALPGNVEDAVRQASAGAARYLELIRASSLSAGVYVLPVGSEDHQQPHTEDELYYVARGRGRFRRSGAERSVRPGDLLFVPAGAEHRFVSVEEELVLVVFFAPPEDSTAPRAVME
jgi:quercetin dioxygenase-like cupin family protein